MKAITLLASLRETIEALCAMVRLWFRFRRVCAWCGRRMGGNPLASSTTHTICPGCMERMGVERL
jgi:hypothetical protein